MKSHHRLICLFGLLSVSGLFAQEEAVDEDRAASLVILNEIAVRNLRLETVVAEERDFETTVFAVGRVEEIPANRYSLSSRIPGRAVEVNAFIGDQVEAGQILVKVESRQPGNPPPTIDLKALQTGIVVESDILRGQPVEPESELLDISDRSEMWIVAQIPEQLARGVGPGTKARISFPALDGEPIEAEMLRFGVRADRDAGAIEGVFQVPNPDYRLQPGMRAEFSIIVATRQNVLAVPEEAVQGDPARRVVYVTDFELDNAFVRAPVALGEKGGGWIEVLSGLFPGDEVVTRGSYSLGFVGAGSGMSLKEALDAAHGHEHNEDGSEKTAEQEAAGHEGHDHGAHGAGGAPGWLLYYAIGATLAVLFLAQQLWNAKRRRASEAAPESAPQESKSATA